MRLLIMATFLFTASAAADDYSTTETVRFVVGCMAENGGNTEENLYACACRFDVVSSQMSFRDYEAARLYERYREMPGERGALFRDTEPGEKLKGKLAKVREQAAQRCPLVKHIEAPPKQPSE